MTIQELKSILFGGGIVTIILYLIVVLGFAVAVSYLLPIQVV